MEKAPLIPLCRVYQNESKRTGKPYLIGNLSYTAKLIGFESEDEQGNPCWQLLIQERPLKTLAGQNGRTPVPMAEQPGAGDRGGICSDYRRSTRSTWRKPADKKPNSNVRLNSSGSRQDECRFFKNHTKPGGLDANS